jgi:hypothetical protein
VKGKLTAKELTTLIGAVNRNAPELTKDTADAYALRLGVDTSDLLKGLNYNQVSNILLRLQDFVDILPASASITFALEVSAMSEPKNAFLELVKADYEAKVQSKASKEEAQTTLPGGEVQKTAG